MAQAHIYFSLDSSIPKTHHLAVNYRSAFAPSVEDVFVREVLPRYTQARELKTGRPIKNFGLRLRELLGLCLLSYFFSMLTKERWVPGTDPFQRDGLIKRVKYPANFGKIRPVHLIEQVFVPEGIPPSREITNEVISSLDKKDAKGTTYAENTNLVILVDNIDAEYQVEALIARAKTSTFQAIYLFIMRNPKPYWFDALTLKNPQGDLGSYELKIDSAGSAKMAGRDTHSDSDE